jgi:hypothetical protein
MAGFGNVFSIKRSQKKINELKLYNNDFWQVYLTWIEKELTDLANKENQHRVDFINSYYHQTEYGKSASDYNFHEFDDKFMKNVIHKVNPFLKKYAKLNNYTIDDILKEDILYTVNRIAALTLSENQKGRFFVDPYSDIEKSIDSTGDAEVINNKDGSLWIIDKNGCLYDKIDNNVDPSIFYDHLPRIFNLKHEQFYGSIDDQYLLLLKHKDVYLIAIFLNDELKIESIITQWDRLQPNQQKITYNNTIRDIKKRINDGELESIHIREMLVDNNYDFVLPKKMLNDIINLFDLENNLNENIHLWSFKLVNKLISIEEFTMFLSKHMQDVFFENGKPYMKVNDYEDFVEFFENYDEDQVQKVLDTDLFSEVEPSTDYLSYSEYLQMLNDDMKSLLIRLAPNFLTTENEYIKELFNEAYEKTTELNVIDQIYKGFINAINNHFQPFTYDKKRKGHIVEISKFIELIFIKNHEVFDYHTHFEDIGSFWELLDNFKNEIDGIKLDYDEPRYGYTAECPPDLWLSELKNIINEENPQ